MCSHCLHGYNRIICSQCLQVKLEALQLFVQQRWMICWTNARFQGESPAFCPAVLDSLLYKWLFSRRFYSYPYSSAGRFAGQMPVFKVNLLLSVQQCWMICCTKGHFQGESTAIRTAVLDSLLYKCPFSRQFSSYSYCSAGRFAGQKAIFKVNLQLSVQQSWTVCCTGTQNNSRSARPGCLIILLYCRPSARRRRLPSASPPSARHLPAHCLPSAPPSEHPPSARCRLLSAAPP